eukprot:TRINITY_DN3371_c1_g1_i1.p1 TRINITY_DN3371_c1_g1~~TRINITY_DN3371_c1_g1_i1.p1  ORF type:complete len:494 (+),score=-5.03 TRINITY_DN3371_c1_g1_i1:186-1484(+)
MQYQFQFCSGKQLQGKSRGNQSNLFGKRIVLQKSLGRQRRQVRVNGTRSVAGGSLKGFWSQDAGIIKSASFVRQKFDIEDPGLNQQLISSGTNMSQFFDPDLWSYHRRVNRYFEHIFSVRQSTVLRRVLKPCIILTFVAAAVFAFNYAMLHIFNFPRLVLQINPLVHQLLGAVLSLQLVFKTNSSFARFDEGRRIWSSLVRYSRDFIRIASLQFSKELLDRTAACLKVYCNVLRCELRQGERMKQEIKQTLNCYLPRHKADLLFAQPNVTLAVILELAQILKDASSQTPDFLKKRLESYLSELCQILTNCERIYHTPIPLSYTRHTTRSLMLWWSTLPLALYPVLNWQMIPAIFVGSYLFLGIDEIGVEIEEPFCILPLTPLCKVIESSIDQAISTNLEFSGEKGIKIENDIGQLQRQANGVPSSNGYCRDI